MDLLKVLFGSCWTWLDRRGLWCPVGWADFSMGLYKLERLYQTECFFHTAAHRKVVDTQVLDDTIRVNNEETSECNASTFQQHSVVSGYLLSYIRQQCDVHVAQTTILSWCVDPGKMTEVGIH